MGRTLESRVSITATSRSCWLLVSWNSSRWITERRTFFQRFCSPTVSLAFFFFVSGGSGVSWTLPFLCDMVRKSHDRVTMKLQKLTWIWIIREEGEFKQKDVKNKHFDRRQTLVDVIPTFTPCLWRLSRGDSCRGQLSRAALRLTLASMCLADLKPSSSVKPTSDQLLSGFPFLPLRWP